MRITALGPVCGHGAFTIGAGIGTTEQIAEGLQTVSDVGFDGSLLSRVSYEAGLRRFSAEVMPLQEQAGLWMPSSLEN